LILEHPLSDGKSPPFSAKAEEYLIACCLLDGNLTLSRAITKGIRSDAFHVPANRTIWDHLIKAHGRDGRISIEVVAEDLKQAKLLEDIGGFAHLMNVSGLVPTTASAEYFIDKVQELYQLRQAITIATSAVERCHLYQGGGVSALVGEIVHNLSQVANGDNAGEKPLSDIIDEVERWTQAQERGERPEGALTLGWMDQRFLPVERHEIVVIGARPSDGKSSLALQVVGENIAAGKRVAHFSLETSPEACVRQIAAQRARLNLRNYRHELEPHRKAFHKALGHLREGKWLRVFDRVQVTQIEAQCRLLRSSWKPDVVVIDYLQQVVAPGKSVYERITEIANRIVELRKHMDCPMVVCAQLNRGSVLENRAPRKEDFRDSGAIEQAAHRVLLLYRPNEDFSGISQMDTEESPRRYYDYQIIQAKLRDGPKGSLKAKFDSHSTTFSPYTGM